MGTFDFGKPWGGHPRWEWARLGLALGWVVSLFGDDVGGWNMLTTQEGLWS